MKYIILTILFLLNITGQFIHAQTDTSNNKQQISFYQFLYLVSQNNLEYAAEKFNIQISEAAIELARVFPDPSISFDWNEYRKSNARVGYGYVSELAGTIELGGKRKARIDLASTQNELSRALLDDYFRNLRADAAIVYLEAVMQDKLYEVKLDSYQTMKKLANADSIRLSLGSIMKTDAIQSKLEAGMLLNELLQTEAEQQNSFNQLNLMAGISQNDTAFFPINELNKNSQQFILDSLIAMALENRSDLEAARYEKEASEKAIVLAKKERIIDMDLLLGFENELASPNTIPGLHTFSAGIAIPIKFSNVYKGDLKMAQLYDLQAGKNFAYVQLKIRTEINEAYQNYIAEEKQVENFKTNLLDQSHEVLNGKIYSYQRGETSLLEVLNAQRMYNAIQTSYIETLNKNYTALIELERVAGIWDINF